MSDYSLLKIATDILKAGTVWWKRSNITTTIFSCNLVYLQMHSDPLDKRTSSVLYLSESSGIFVLHCFHRRTRSSCVPKLCWNATFSKAFSLLWFLLLDLITKRKDMWMKAWRVWSVLALDRHPFHSCNVMWELWSVVLSAIEFSLPLAKAYEVMPWRHPPRHFKEIITSTQQHWAPCHAVSCMK